MDMESSGSAEMDGSGLVFVSTVKPPIFYTFCALSGLVLALDVICLIFFMIFRNRKIIRLTSPKLNYVTLVAVFFLSLAGILYTVPTADLVTMRVLCPIRSLSISLLGFDLCFSVLLVKLCRIVYIFRKPITTKKVITDKYLLIGVILVMLPDILLYLVLLPPEIVMPDVGMEQNGEEPYVLNEMGKWEENYFLTCGNSTFYYVRVSLTFTYKIIVQGLALVLALLTRNIKIPSLDDARYVNILVYVTTTLSLIVITGSFVLMQYPNIYAVCLAASSIGVAVSILTLLFIPKMVILYRDPKGRNIFRSSNVDSLARVRSISTQATTL